MNDDCATAYDIALDSEAPGRAERLKTTDPIAYRIGLAEYRDEVWNVPA